MGKLTDKVVFVTGSSKGIGKAVAIELLKAGARVVLNGRNSQVLAKTAEALSTRGEVMQIAADVSESHAFEDALKKIIEHFGKLDVLVLNAGLSSYGAVERTSDNSLESVMRVNTFGPFRGARIALPELKKNGGSVVFISSLAGLHGTPYASVYSMSKMALTALAQSMKTELTGEGVHVGIVYVGFTKNEPDKTTVAPDGSIRPLQERPGYIQQPVEKVARHIVRSIRRRRFRTTLSPMGKFMGFFIRFFPRAALLVIRGMRKQAAKLTAE
jgi:short-subunit dehydrogenase